MVPLKSSLRTLAMLCMVWLMMPSSMAATSPVQNDLCENVCGEEVACSQECDSYIPQGPLFPTTCGEYNGGYDNDQCDGYPFFDCTYVCDGLSSPSTECLYDGELESCESWFSLSCGDDICEGGEEEDCSSCSADCGACPEDNDELDDEWLDVMGEGTGEGYLNGSAQGYSQFLELADAAGLIPDGDYEVGEWADDEFMAGTQQQYAWGMGWYDCTVRTERVKKLNKVQAKATVVGTIAALMCGRLPLPAKVLACDVAGVSAMVIGATTTVRNNASVLPCFRAPGGQP